MDSAKINDWLQIIGIFALVLSLIFVGLQIRQEQEIAIVDTYGSVAETEIDLSILIGEYFEVWRKGLEGETLTENEKGLFRGLATAVESQYQRNFIRWSRIGPGDPDSIASEFAFALYSFPGLRESFESKQRFDTKRDEARGFKSNLSPWESLISQYLEKYDEERPDLPEPREYLFFTI